MGVKQGINRRTQQKRTGPRNFYAAAGEPSPKNLAAAGRSVAIKMLLLLTYRRHQNSVAAACVPSPSHRPLPAATAGDPPPPNPAAAAGDPYATTGNPSSNPSKSISKILKATDHQQQQPDRQ